MRRFAAVALSAGTLMAGMAAISAPAQADSAKLVDSAASTAASTAAAPTASAAARSWKAINSYPRINAWGTYTRSGGKTYVKAYLQDTKANYYTACVRFLFQEGKRATWSRHHIVGVRPNGTRYFFDGEGTITIRTSSSYSSHLWVQECGRSSKTKKFYYGKGKKLF
ncbi:hypothetical protein [Actinomadura sp. 6N118]|uniref:hypothetical protein n=1 Tax=Actinomadura sp. 6N118 TaxID=3375151 RepID=UPI0037A21EC6